MFFSATRLIFCLLCLPDLALANVSKINVDLLGQPCTLEGNKKKHTEDSLNQIHALGPEKFPPATTSQEAMASLKKLETILITPKDLINYREALKKYYLSKQAFYDGLESAKKSKLVKTFTEAIQKFVPARKLHTLTQMAERYLNPDPESGNASEDFFEYYEKISPIYPEQDFHRSLRKMGVEYHCVLDRGE